MRKRTEHIGIDLVHVLLLGINSTEYIALLHIYSIWNLFTIFTIIMAWHKNTNYFHCGDRFWPETTANNNVTAINTVMNDNPIPDSNEAESFISHDREYWPIFTLPQYSCKWKNMSSSKLYWNNCLYSKFFVVIDFRLINKGTTFTLLFYFWQHRKA